VEAKRLSDILGRLEGKHGKFDPRTVLRALRGLMKDGMIKQIESNLAKYQGLLGLLLDENIMEVGVETRLVQSPVGLG